MNDTSLARRLGLGDAVTIGLGSMIGAGVFVAFSPAAAVAQGGLVISLLLAALVAFCNATSSAQLAARYPTSGGTYVYGREELGEWPGFIAGWGFVIGKTASCAAMALAFASYLVPDSGWLQRAVGALAVTLIVAVNCRGVTRTAGMARAIVAAVLVVLVAVVAACFATAGTRTPAPVVIGSASPFGVLQGAGILFFAFAGYARIATLGEEVVHPRRTIPRAILIALGSIVLIYAAVGAALLVVLGVDGVAATRTPVLTAARQGIAPWLAPVVQVAAGLASLGALLALVAGIGRTVLAMARNDDLPSTLAAVHPRHQVPARAEMVVGSIVVLLVLTLDLRGAIGFSSFGVLAYYGVANAAALRQSEQRLYPRGLQVVGLLGCLALLATLPWGSVAAGIGVYAVGVLYRVLRRRCSGESASVSST